MSIHARGLLLATLGAVCGRAPAQQLPREWNQRYGNAANTSACDVEPIRAPPKEAWQQRFDAILAGPIATSERVVVVVREGKDRRLVSLRPDTGEIVGRKTLDKGGDRVDLVGEKGIVAVVEPERTKAFLLTNDILRLEWTLPGPFEPDAILAEGRLFVRESASDFLVCEMQSGKKLGSVRLGVGRPSFAKVDGHGLNAATLSSARVLGAADVTFDGTARARLLDRPTCDPVGWTARGSEKSVILVRSLAPDLDKPWWYAFVAESTATSRLMFENAWLEVAFASAPAMRGSELYGFDVGGELVFADAAKQKAFGLLAADQRPKGAVRGAPSIARSVLFLGNWAIELDGARVLWCLEGFAPGGPLVPVGDGLAVAGNKAGVLIGLADPTRAAPATAAGAAPAERPRAPSEDAALAASLAGDPYATYSAFVDALRADRIDLLIASFDRFAGFKLYDDCQQLLQELKVLGVDARRAEELARRVAGKSASKAENAPLQRKKVQGEQVVALEKLRVRTLAAADWCGTKGMPFAATALVARAAELLPDSRPELQRIAAWIPKSFPWTSEDDANARWLAWADALLPSGARFVGKEDPVWGRVKGTAFEKESVAIATDDLLLFTREWTPAIVGPCLVRGQAAVKALARLVGKSPVDAPTASEPLEIRLHRTRDEYLGDTVEGDKPEPWSAGVYSPREGVSRFYARSGNEAADGLGRQLHAVLAHELTHHYLDRRWIPSRRSHAIPGIWMVEGFAEFVCEQAVEMGRRGEALDDPTVRSLDVSAAMLKKNALLPSGFLLALDYQGFDTKLDDDKPVLVELRHSLGRGQVDRRALFYHQSAALTFFALRRGGDAARTGYLQLLASYYAGRIEPQPWKKLGYADLTSLDKAFLEFLATL